MIVALDVRRASDAREPDETTEMQYPSPARCVTLSGKGTQGKRRIEVLCNSPEIGGYVTVARYVTDSSHDGGISGYERDTLQRGGCRTGSGMCLGCRCRPCAPAAALSRSPASVNDSVFFACTRRYDVAQSGRFVDSRRPVGGLLELSFLATRTNASATTERPLLPCCTEHLRQIRGAVR